MTSNEAESEDTKTKGNKKAIPSTRDGFFVTNETYSSLLI